MAGTQRNDLGRVFNEVPELYDRVRPTYPRELFTDLVGITGLDKQSSVLEIGCGTGQATRSLAGLGGSVTAVELGADMAALARQRLAAFDNVEVETSSFEGWDDRGRCFDLLVAASSWHWVDPSVGWRRAHDVLQPGVGWHCSATSLSVGPVSERCTPRLLTSTNGSSPVTPIGAIRHSKMTCAQRTQAGDWSKTPAACSARRSCGGIRWCSGSTGRVSPISFVRHRSTASSTATFVNPCSTRSPSASVHAWAIEYHAVT